MVCVVQFEEWSSYERENGANRHVDCVITRLVRDSTFNVSAERFPVRHAMD